MTMKKIIKYLFVCLVVLLGAGLQSCSDGPDFDNYVYPPAETKESLSALITTCTELVNAAETGNKGGQYLAYVVENFQTAINKAKVILSNDKATQPLVDQAVKQLQSAHDVFLESANVGDLDPNDENLVLHLRFSNNILDGSASGHDLVLNAGNALCGNGQKPSFTTDRYGKESSAMHFENGGNISIPHVEGKSESLNPEVMTFMCWVKESATPAPVQRWIFCLDTWNIFYIVIPQGGTEFQLGGQTTRGWIDPIMNSGIHASANWTHLAVTYSPSGAAFYKNGELIRSYAGLGNLVRAGAKTPFLIGIMHPDRELYFNGDMDEFRLYNKALSASEVRAVFNLEKPESMAIEKTALAEAITAAQGVRDASTVGFNEGQYLQSVVDTFTAVIDAASVIYADKNATQNQTDNAVKELETASQTFAASANTQDYNPHLTLGLAFDNGLADVSYCDHTVVPAKGTNDLPPYPAIDRYGRYDGAYHFDKGSYLSIAFNKNLNPQELTYMFWIKAAEPSGQGDPYLLSINRRFGFYLGLNGDEFVFGGAGVSGTISEVRSGAQVSGEWQHVALTYSISAGIKLFVDGNLVKSAAAQGALAEVTNKTPFVIGVKGTTDNASSYFRGDMDEIGVYDRPMEESEIFAIYNQQKP